MNTKPIPFSGLATADLHTHYDVMDDTLAELIHREIQFQESSINLTAACNYLSPLVGSSMHPALNNIHCEGYPGRRYHEGQTIADDIEQLAVNRAKHLFKADHANVQPYRGTMANVAACVACCDPGDTVLGFACDAGGHFTTGAQIHITSQLYKVETYGLDPESHLLDYDEIAARADQVKPRVIFVGDTAYPRAWDWHRLRQIADVCGARLVADVSQTGGLIAAQLIDSPVGIADIVTMATYKTLRGPRAGLVLCNDDMKTRVDRAVFPTCQDGTNVMLVAGLAAALFEAMQPAFRRYCQQVLDNCAKLAGALSERHQWQLVTGGTMNHACLIDLSTTPLTGRVAARALARANIVCNANQIPFDPCPPAKPSGLRLGTAAVTTLGMTPSDMTIIADMIDRTLNAVDNEAILARVAEEAQSLREQFSTGLAHRRLSPPTPRHLSDSFSSGAEA